MSPDFRRGWRAACVANAKKLSNEAVTLANKEVARLFMELAGELARTPCPHTLSIIDEAGKPLVKP